MFGHVRVPRKCFFHVNWYRLRAKDSTVLNEKRGLCLECRLSGRYALGQSKAEKGHQLFRGMIKIMKCTNTRLVYLTWYLAIGFWQVPDSGVDVNAILDKIQPVHSCSFAVLSVVE